MSVLILIRNSSHLCHLAKQEWTVIHESEREGTEVTAETGALLENEWQSFHVLSSHVALSSSTWLQAKQDDTECWSNLML